MVEIFWCLILIWKSTILYFTWVGQHVTMKGWQCEAPGHDGLSLNVSYPTEDFSLVHWLYFAWVINWEWENIGCILGLLSGLRYFLQHNPWKYWRSGIWEKEEREIKRQVYFIKARVHGKISALNMSLCFRWICISKKESALCSERFHSLLAWLMICSPKCQKSPL